MLQNLYIFPNATCAQSVDLLQTSNMFETVIKKIIKNFKLSSYKGLLFKIFPSNLKQNKILNKIFQSFFF